MSVHLFTFSRYISLSAAGLLLLSACNSKPKPETETQLRPAGDSSATAIHKPEPYVAGKGPRRPEKPKGLTQPPKEFDSAFLRFWRPMRPSLIRLDSAKLIKSTKFPFIIHDEAGTAPVLKRSRQNFMPALRHLLASEGIAGRPTQKDVIRQSIHHPLDSTAVNSPEKVRIGNMEFHHTPSGWMLTDGYLPSGELEELRKK